MRFYQEDSESNTTIRTDHGIDLEFYFDLSKDPCQGTVYIDGFDHDLYSDTLRGLFVAIGGEFISMTDLIEKAKDAHEELLERNLAIEARLIAEERDYYRLSCYQGEI